MRKTQNYLEKIPTHKKGIEWTSDKDGLVTVSLCHKGIMKKIVQVLLKKPKVSYIHLEQIGSFVWQAFDGKKNIITIARELDQRFGKKVHPLYERLASYIMMLDKCGFIEFDNKKGGQ